MNMSGAADSFEGSSTTSTLQPDGSVSVLLSMPHTTFAPSRPKQQSHSACPMRPPKPTIPTLSIIKLLSHNN